MSAGDWGFLIVNLILQPIVFLIFNPFANRESKEYRDAVEKHWRRRMEERDL